MSRGGLAPPNGRGDESAGEVAAGPNATRLGLFEQERTQALTIKTIKTIIIIIIIII